jgi:hypothetical protein
MYYERIFRVVFQQLIEGIATIKLGSSTVDSLIAAKGSLRIKKCLKAVSRINKIKKEFNRGKSQLDDLCHVCLKIFSPVTVPIALISQIQRSGGSLLSQLFDGHGQLHAHPHELMIGYPKKYLWPRINLRDKPERWFEVLFEDIVIKHFKEGYNKGKKHERTFPFIFLPSVQKEIFLRYIDSFGSLTLRDVFDAYLTSYFGAWLNYQNAHGRKKFVTAFTPRLAMMKNSVQSFFEVYPDGRLISLVRDPKNWYPSVARHEPATYGDIRNAMGLWHASTQAMMYSKEKFGESCCIIKFEDLVSKTESVMHYLANFLGIQFDEILLTPTFNKYAIRANTSFELEEAGILQSALMRYKTLKEEEIEIINEMTRKEYQKVLDNSVQF